MSRKLFDTFFSPSNIWKLPTLTVHGDLHMSVSWWAVSSFGKKKGHTRVCWDIWKASCCYQGRVGKRSKVWGLFDNFTLQFWSLTQRDLGRQRLLWTRAKTRAVHTESWKGCGFCRTSYNMVIKLWVRKEQLGSCSILLKIVSWEDSSAPKTCLIYSNTEPEESLEQQLSNLRWSLRYKYSHWELHVDAFRLVPASDPAPTSWARTLHYMAVLN